MLKLTTDKHEASRGFSATAELLVLTELLGPTPTPLRRSMHLQQVTTALIIITSHHEFR